MIVALFGGAILVYDVQLRRRQLRETLSRSYSTLNVDFQVSIHPTLADKPEWVLETRVIIENAGSEIRAIPAAYVHARALPELSDGNSQMFLEKDFGSLRPVAQLSVPMNIARFDSAIWHVGPGETDSVVRWDVLSGELIQQNPIIIVRLEIYNLPHEFVGAADFPSNAGGVDRRQWLEFMERDEGARHKQVIFAHAAKDVDCIKKGDWVFLIPGTEDIDIEASTRFRTILDNLAQTGRQILVVLNPPESKVFTHNSPQAEVAAEERSEIKRPTLNRTTTANSAVVAG
ncbi:MAG TPA: hypothetical protein VF789_22525 [Thermoanaerobaculia bacterium]